jgi:formate dehydrogenase subunit gamma
MVRRVTVDKMAMACAGPSALLASACWKAILMIDVASLFPRDAPGIVRSVLERHAGEPGALLPILHDVQDALGYIPADSVPAIAKALNLSRAEVHGVITYYHHFRSKPAGRIVVQVCRAESCKACGADALMAHAEKLLGCASHHTRADGAVTLEPVFCLGLCASSPAIMVGDKLFARVTPDKLERVVASLG